MQIKRLSTSQVLIRLISVIFIVEALVMLLFHFIELDLPPFSEAILDSLLLTSLSFPFIYFGVISPYKNAERKAKKSLYDYQYAMNEHAIIALTDVQGTILEINDLFCKISGYSREELIGKNHRILNSGNQDKSYWRDMYRTVAKGSPWHDQILNRAKDGHLYWVDTTIVPIMGEDHKPEYYIAVRSDITYQKELQATIENYSSELEEKVQQRTQQLEQAKEYAEKAKEDAEYANEEKTRFLANMSHELRTPLHAIMSFSNLGLKLARQEKVQSYFHRINTSGQRLADLINNLLDLSKLGAGKQELNLDKNDLTEVALSSVDSLSSLATDKRLLIDILTDEMFIGIFDRQLIMQVIVNLLSNAIKFSQDGQIIEIEIYKQFCKPVDGPDEEPVRFLFFKITDQGVGIPSEEHEKVFDAFSQSSLTRTNNGGTGLGLPISKEIIQLHGGNIWVESPPVGREMGSVFYFKIPEKPLSSIEYGKYKTQ
ncbi:MAG: PAS domain-containing sensor histidine kinase [Gammaproteobacteria bacterium]